MWCLAQLLDRCRRYQTHASIACRSLLPAPFPDQGSFPPPALPGFAGTTTLSATPGGRFRASRHHRWPAPPRQPPRGASRVAHDPSAHMPSPLPRRNRWVLASFAFPNGGGLPRNSGGSASALPFSRPARRSLHVTACALAESLTRDLRCSESPEPQGNPTCGFFLYPANRGFSGDFGADRTSSADFHPKRARGSVGGPRNLGKGVAMGQDGRV